MIKVGIVGASGYTGIELIRLLDYHSQVCIKKLFSQKTAGNKISELFPHLGKKYDLKLEEFSISKMENLDVIFLALPHGEAQLVVPQLLEKNIKVIDLSADFRLNDAKKYEKYYNLPHKAANLIKKAVVGFPEIYRNKIKKANLLANPGCYATSAILGLYPLAKEGLIKDTVIIDAKSGVSGAGKSLKETSLFCEANENITSYQTFVHRHVPEIEQELNINVFFNPHLVPMNRGILSSIYLENKNKFTKDELVKIYQKYYKNEPFIKLLPDLSMPSTKYVKGTNNCAISFGVFKETNKMVIFSAIDNLIKGVSGQAIQNMNIMFGLDETLGLQQLGYYL